MDNERKDSIIKKAMQHMGKPIDEITRRMTYRSRSPGVKPTTGIKLILPKTSSMAEKIQKVLDGDDPKKLKQMNNLVIGREDDGKEISLEFKTSASREKFRKMMNEDVELDETVKIMFKGFGKEVTDFQQKLKKFGQAADYRIMMQNFKNHSNVGDGLYFTDTSKGLGFEIHSVRDRIMGDKIRKLGDSQDLGGGKTVTLIAIKEDVQLDEASQHIVNVNVSRTGFRKLEAMIASLDGYRESDYSDGKARFYFDAKKHDSAERKKVAEFIKKTRGAEFSHAMKEDVQLDEGTMNFLFDSPLKAGAFAQRIMRDKLASEVDRYVDHGKRKEVVELITHPNNYEKNDILKLAKQYKGTVHSVEEDVQLDETNFRFPQPGEDYGELGMSINDPDSFSGSGPSRAELKKRSAEVDRKFASVMRKHKRTKVGEVLDLLDKDGGTKLYKDSDIKQISKYLTKFKDNVRKVAHEMLIIVMQGDDYLAKKRIPIREDVQLDENVQNQVKRMDRRAKQRLAKKLNDLDLSGYGDYEARVDNVHKFKSSDLKMAMEMMSLKEAESLRWTSMKDTEREELVRLAGVPSRAVQMEWKKIPAPLKEKLAKYINKSTKGEFALVEEKAMTYVIDRKTKKIVHGPTDTGDAKLYLNKQVQPRKFVIRQIRGAAKKVGDTV